jgi:CHASE3 domain sensor protein
VRLRRRLQTLLLVFLVLIAVGLVVDLLAIGQRDDARDRISQRLEPAKEELANLELALLDQETGQRGYLITGSERFLAPYRDGRATAERSLDSLRDLLRDDPDLAAGVQRVRSRVQAWQELGADFEIDARRDDRIEVLRALVTGGTSRRLFEAAREEAAFLRLAVDDALADARASVERRDRLVLAVELATVGLAVAFVGLLAVLISRWVVGPLDDLGRSVRSVASGSLASAVTVAGPPDLADLAADVDSMRRRILAEVDDAARAREALADRGMVVLTLRDELAAGDLSVPPGIRFAGRFQPAAGIVAGDWFDVVRLDADRVALALVDVSGHGAGVGAFALRTKALTLAAICTHEPGDALGWVASRLGDTGEQFLTGVIVVLDAATGHLRYASAGHPPMLLGGLTGVDELGATGPLLGPVRGTWETAEAQLDRGGVLAVYSDGLVEARDHDRQPFGVARLREVVERTQLGGPEAVADACLAAVSDHQVLREDDLTLCVLGR